MKNNDKLYTRTSVKADFVSAAVNFAAAIYFCLSAINERMMLIDHMRFTTKESIALYALAAFFFGASAVIFTRAMKALEYMDKNKVSGVRKSQLR